MKRKNYTGLTNKELVARFVLIVGNGYYGDRVFISECADFEVREFLKSVSKWGGSDKRTGQRVGFELKRCVTMDELAKQLSEKFGMIRDDRSEVMNDLINTY